MTPEEMKGHILRHEGMIASNARGISDLKEEVSLGRSENRLQHSDLGNSIDIVRAGVNEIREKLIYQRGVKHFLTRMRIWPLAAAVIPLKLARRWASAWPS